MRAPVLSLLAHPVRGQRRHPAVPRARVRRRQHRAAGPQLVLVRRWSPRRRRRLLTRVRVDCTQVHEDDRRAAEAL